MARNLMTSTMRSSRVVVGLALLLCVAGAPERAQAVVIVTDPTNLIQNTISAINNAGSYTKDYVLDTLAWQVGNMAIESITKSTVNWINSGFQGSPAFVTDLNQNLQGVGDAVAARFFDELSQQTIATTPFQDRVLDSVRLGYYLHTSPESFYTRYPYTLDQVSANDRAFLAGDFRQGGWNAWFATVMNPQNNPYGAQMLADRALSDAVAGATGTRLQELSWNRGFLSWRGECTAERDINDPVLLSGVDNCAKYEIKTPGSVIMESLNKVEGIPFDRLVSADEFNEVIGALLNQLALQILGGGDGGGVRGLSRPASDGSGTFFDRTSSASTQNVSGIAASFGATIARQKQQLIAYRDAWEKIRSAAEAARDRCDGSERESAQVVLDRAAVALVKAADAIAAISAIEADIAAASSAGGNQSQNLLSAAEAYNTLTTSGTLPTPEEIAEAQTESLDTGDETPGSLYSQMSQLAANNCRAGE